MQLCLYHSSGLFSPAPLPTTHLQQPKVEVVQVRQRLQRRREGGGPPEIDCNGDVIAVHLALSVVSIKREMFGHRLSESGHVAILKSVRWHYAYRGRTNPLVN